MDSCLDTIKQANYSINIGNRPVSVNFVRMKDSFFLWIGSPYNTSLSNLSVSIDSQFGIPSTTVLLSNINLVCFIIWIEVDNNDFSERLSRLLSKKFSKLVYVSCGLSFSEEEEETLRSALVTQLAQLL